MSTTTTLDGAHRDPLLDVDVFAAAAVLDPRGPLPSVLTFVHTVPPPPAPAAGLSPLAWAWQLDAAHREVERLRHALAAESALADQWRWHVAAAGLPGSNGDGLPGADVGIDADLPAYRETVAHLLMTP